MTMRSRLGWRVAAALLLAGCGGEPMHRGAEVGAPAPEYAAVSMEGDSVSLAGLRGRVVLVNIWATWCPPCREEIPALQALHEAHADEGLTLVGVSVDTRAAAEEVRAFAVDFGITYPIWLDPEERVASTFQTIGVPSTFLIDRDGTLLWKHVGPVSENDPTLLGLLEKALAE